MARRQGVAAALLLAMLAVGSPVGAQPAEGPTVDFVVTPSKLAVEALPGQVREIPIEVFNRGQSALHLDTYIEDIEISKSELIDPNELSFTATRWVSFAGPSLEVDVGSSSQALLRVFVPSGTPPGGYHAFAFFQSRPVESESGVLPSGRVGVTLLLDVVPAGVVLTRSARVSETSVDIRWKGPFDADVVASTTIDNTGDAHVATGGVHRMLAWPGQRSDEVKLGPWTLLRGTRHTFETTWSAVPLIGKVTVTSELVYQAGPDDLPAIIIQRTVWIIPWHLLAVLVILLLAGGALLLRRRKGSGLARAPVQLPVRAARTGTMEHVR